jgi:hypothetical protein
MEGKSRQKWPFLALFLPTLGIGSKLLGELDLLYNTQNGRSYGIPYGVVQNSVMRDWRTSGVNWYHKLTVIKCFQGLPWLLPSSAWVLACGCNWWFGCWGRWGIWGLCEGEREEGQLGEQMKDLLHPHECQTARSSSILHISVATAMPKSILEKPLSRCNSKSQWSSSMLSKSCDNLCAYQYLCHTTVDSSVEVTAILRSISEVIAQDCKCRHRLHSSYAISRSGNWKEWGRGCRENNLQMQFL